VATAWDWSSDRSFLEWMSELLGIRVGIAVREDKLRSIVRQNMLLLSERERNHYKAAGELLGRSTLEAFGLEGATVEDLLARRSQRGAVMFTLAAQTEIDVDFALVAHAPPRLPLPRSPLRHQRAGTHVTKACPSDQRGCAVMPLISGQPTPPGPVTPPFRS
jgi:hypothetical protein